RFFIARSPIPQPARPPAARPLPEIRSRYADVLVPARTRTADQRRLPPGPGTLSTEPGSGLRRNCPRIVSVHLHEYSVPRGTGNARSCREPRVAPTELG